MIKLPTTAGDTLPRASSDDGLKPMIQVCGVSRSFENGRIQALRCVDVSIARGEFLAIVGPSGSGKSTLLQLLGALDRPTSGEIFFEQKPLSLDRDLAAFRSHTIGFIFQSFHLLPTLTALENVQIPMFEMDWSAVQRRKRAEELLVRVGLAGRLHQPPAHLSGGERQRVAIARSLANEPKLILADEPTGNLDSENAQATMQLLNDLQKEKGATLIVVTHDPQVVSQVKRKIRLLDGRVVEDTACSQ